MMHKRTKNCCQQVMLLSILGIEIVRKALRLPMLTIISNAGLDPHPIVEKIVAQEGDFGYDALNNEFGNLVEKGIIDPTKVTFIGLDGNSYLWYTFLVGLK